MSIRLTESAVQRVQQFIDQDGGLGLRLGVRRTGCSGWAYEVSLAHELRSDDHVFAEQGVKVVVDAESLPFLDGSSVDFVVEGLQRTFRFDNPNATEACGCGESFTVQ